MDIIYNLIKYLDIDIVRCYNCGKYKNYIIYIDYV